MNDLKVLYEDNHLIVVIKPVGVLSQADSSSSLDMLTIIKDYLKRKYQKPGNVYLGLLHRLDKQVSGIMVFAKTSKAASRLSEQIRNGLFKKYYYAIIEGILPNNEGTFVDRIEKIDNKKVYLNTKNGKHAELEYKVLKVKDNMSLVDIHLLTGRYHQIRLQFSSRGYPLYGDEEYGSLANDSIALFAYKISFVHPISKEVMQFEVAPSSAIFKSFFN